MGNDEKKANDDKKRNDEQKTSKVVIKESKNNQHHVLREKVFKDRRSLLEQLYDEEHIRNIHHLFKFFLFVLFVNQLVYGILYEQRWSLSLDLLYHNFSDVNLLLFGWFSQLLIILSVHPILKLWMFVNRAFGKSENFMKLWNYTWLLLVLVGYYQSLKFSALFAQRFDLSVTSSFTMLIEQTRFLMKAHAFIRDNAPKAWKAKKEAKVATFKHYAYFLFVPTLVYRDSYPQKNSINWLKVMISAAETCAIIMFICFVFDSSVSPVCHQFQTEKYYLRDVAWAIFKNTLPCMIQTILLFYLVLHTWQNIFGELTYFADREFYLDWWNSTTYAEFYRKWNVVVHDWLYQYIFKDAMEFLELKSPTFAKFLVFFVSAIFHEYILWFTTRMFYPVLFVVFLVIGTLMAQLRFPKIWVFNVLFFYFFALGMSLNLHSYVLEYCVRTNPCAFNSTNYPSDFLYSKTYFSGCLLK